MTCQPIHCSKCDSAIQCDDGYIDVGSGYGRLGPFLCGNDKCVSGKGRWIIHYCSTACRWRHRRARLRVAPKPRKCATCRKTFTPQRSDAKTCGSACRQTLYRRRLIA